MENSQILKQNKKVKKICSAFFLNKSIVWTSGNSLKVKENIQFDPNENSIEFSVKSLKKRIHEEYGYRLHPQNNILSL